MIDDLAKLTGTPTELLTELTRRLATEGRWHELFEARLVEARLKLGVPTHLAQPLDELADPLRGQLEAAYTDACREVGQLWLGAGRFREAWRYLRAAGEKPLVRRALAQVVPRSESIDELVEVALYEGVDPERGFGWLLGSYGVCNAVTTLEGVAPSLPPTDLAACVAALVRRVHSELADNLRRTIEQHGDPAPPRAATIPALLADRGWLFDNDSYHIDTSHLAATVRLARSVSDHGIIELASQLAHYGKHLAADLQYVATPPLADGYRAYEMFYAAQLGRDVDAAIEYFTQLADEHTIDNAGPAATEWLVVLLARVGRAGDALREYAERVPSGMSLSSFAPTPLVLAERSGAWSLYDQLATRNNDPVAWLLGRIAQGSAAT